MEPLDTDAIAMRVVLGYADDPEDERLPHAIDDVSLLLSEAGRLSDERDVWEHAAHHLWRVLEENLGQLPSGAPSPPGTPTRRYPWTGPRGKPGEGR